MIDSARRATDRFRGQPGLLAAGLLLAAGGMLLLGGASSSSSSNCFQGVFSDDPVHCQVLAKAYDEDVLDIAAMYEGGDALHVFINNDRSEYEDIDAFVRGQAKAAVQAGDPIAYCYEGSRENKCQYGTLTITRSTLLPPSERFPEIILYPGGEDALRGIRGWASFEKLWPRSDAVFFGASAAADTPPTGPFDLTGLDYTGLDDDCIASDVPSLERAVHERVSCGWWVRQPGAGTAGAMSMGRYPKKTGYVQIKAEPGREAEAIARAQKVITWAVGPDDPGYGSLNSGRTYLVPVKYDFGELWRWRVLLDRFSKLPGNRIGIVSARVENNQIRARSEKQFFIPESGVKPVREIDGWFSFDPVTFRTTIYVYSHDPQATLKGLPKLLEQLGIPGDAVGVVMDARHEPQDVIVLE